MYLKMLAGTLAVNEDTGALNDDIDAHLLPWQGEWVTAGHDADVLAIH